MAVALTAIVLTAVACSKPSVPADDATTDLQRNLQLPDAPLACMRDRFSDGDVAAVMDPEKQPTAEQRAKFVVAVRACVAVDAFAGILADSLAAPDSSEPGDPGQGDCVRRTIEAMTTDEQDQLYVHFSNPAALDADAVRDTSARLIAACGLGGTDPTGTVEGPVQEPGTTPTGP